VLLDTFGRDVGEHSALAGLDHEAVAENVGDFAGDGDGVMIGMKAALFPKETSPSFSSSADLFEWTINRLRKLSMLPTTRAGVA